MKIIRCFYQKQIFLLLKVPLPKGFLLTACLNIQLLYDALFSVMGFLPSGRLVLNQICKQIWFCLDFCWECLTLVVLCYFFLNLAKCIVLRISELGDWVTNMCKYVQGMRKEDWARLFSMMPSGETGRRQQAQCGTQEVLCEHRETSFYCDKKRFGPDEFQRVPSSLNLLLFCEIFEFGFPVFFFLTKEYSSSESIVQLFYCCDLYIYGSRFICFFSRLLLGMKLEDHWKNISLLKCCTAIRISVLLFPIDVGSIARSKYNSSKTY